MHIYIYIQYSNNLYRMATLPDDIIDTSVMHDLMCNTHTVADMVKHKLFVSLPKYASRTGLHTCSDC